VNQSEKVESQRNGSGGREGVGVSAKGSRREAEGVERHSAKFGNIFAPDLQDVQIYHQLSNFVASGPTVVTLGTFDGVHLGHQTLVARAVAKARELGGTAVLLTLEPHPRKLIHPDFVLSRLTLPSERAELLAVAGLDALVEHPFHIVKNLFKHRKVRYRGIKKNEAQLHTLFALANLVMAKKRLLSV
jgi:hypothetical protein